MVRDGRVRKRMTWPETGAFALSGHWDKEAVFGELLNLHARLPTCL